MISISFPSEQIIGIKLIDRLLKISAILKKSNSSERNLKSLEEKPSKLSSKEAPLIISLLKSPSVKTAMGQSFSVTIKNPF